VTDELGVDVLTVSKVVSAQPAAVFDAWTNADTLVAWWRPPGGTCRSARIDLQTGGTYEIINDFPDGSTVTIFGEFLEIIAPESLTYTWGVDPDVEPDQFVSVRFQPRNDGTLVTVRHERIPTVEMLEGHRVGWNSCLDGLAEAVWRGEDT
jgi:uncharacterized protein YndB with AHSA1/START domain